MIDEILCAGRVLWCVVLCCVALRVVIQRKFVAYGTTMCSQTSTTTEISLYYKVHRRGINEIFC